MAKVTILNKKIIDRQLKKHLQEKLTEVGELVVNRAALVLEGELGHPTDRIKNLKYKVEPSAVIIYSDDPILSYLEFGTKPHKIRPKNKKALAFQNTKGLKNFGKAVVVKAVNHPGTRNLEFLSQALFMSKSEIERILKGK